MNWDEFPNFSEPEFACACCGRARVKHELVAKLQRLRLMLGFSIPITSGYRCPEYNEQISTTGRNGPHTTGQAADVGLSRVKARLFIECAVEEFDGIGIKQHGDDRFVHVDYGLGFRIWTYS